LIGDGEYLSARCLKPMTRFVESRNFEIHRGRRVSTANPSQARCEHRLCSI
jgi:hypothetical protein